MKAIVGISDTHFGSNMALLPNGFIDDDGRKITHSKFQSYLQRCWDDFWNVFVPTVTAGAEKCILVHNGDMIEGLHHNAVDLLPNTKDQRRAAIQMMQPVVQKFDKFFMTRGTQTHGGIAEQDTETIAEALGCPRDDDNGQYSQWQVWLDVDGVVFQFAHHIGTTSSAAYETSAPMRELVAAMVEASQWGQRMPHVFVRSHRHRFVPISIPSERGRVNLVVTPAWQLRTPHVERIDRMRLPHIGGVVFLVEDGECQIRERIYRMPKPKPIKI